MTEEAKYKIILNDSQFSAAINKSIAQSNKLDSGMRRVNKTAKTTGSVFGSLVKFNIYGQLISGVTQFATASFQAAKSVDSINKALEVTSGSSEEYGKNIKFIEQSAQSMGLELMSTREAFKTLSAATMGTNLQGAQTRSIFASVANATSKLGVDAETTKGAFLALGQMVSKGKVSAEELRGQLGERLPGAFGIAADAMGVTTMELDKMLQRGEIVSQDFLPKFAKALNEKFGDPVNANAQTLQAFSNRLSNVWTKIKESSVRVFGAIAERLSRITTMISENWSAITEAFSPITDAFRSFREQIRGTGEDSGKTLSLLDKFKAGVNAIGNLLNKLRPVFTSIAKRFAAIYNGVTKVTIAFKKWYDSTETAQTIWKGFVASIVSSWVFVETLFTESFSAIADGFEALFNRDFDGLSKASERLSSNFITAGKKAAEAFKESYNTESKDFFAGKKTKVEASILEQDAAASGGVFDGGLSGVAAGTATTPGKQTSSNVSGVAAGRPTTVNVSINKLIETFNTTIQDAKIGESQITELVSRALLTAVNDVNIIGQ